MTNTLTLDTVGCMMVIGHNMISIDAGNRYSTLNLVPWLDVSLLRQTKALVVGAGALGNEVLKNLALLGVGNIFIIDMDSIEAPNLSRSILFADQDIGQPKAKIAAQRVKQINPDINVQYCTGKLKEALGAGVYRCMDLILGCVDNNEARLWLNSQCFGTNKVWFDGAIDVLSGEVRSFSSNVSDACFECGMEDQAYVSINSRYSCNHLQIEGLILGKQATTPISASILAGIQVQEAIKYLHNHIVRPQVLFYNGNVGSLHAVTRSRRTDCIAHYNWFPILECLELTSYSSLREVLRIASRLLNDDAVLELDRQLLVSSTCIECKNVNQILRPVQQSTKSQVICPICKGKTRLRTQYKITHKDFFIDMALKDIGIPPLHILRVTSNGKALYLEVSGDKNILFNKEDWTFP